MKKYLNIVGLITCGVLVAVGTYTKKAPKPVTAAKCFDDFRVRLNAAWTEGAGQTFETDVAAQKWIGDHGLTAFRDAFAPVRQREQDALGKKYDDAVRQKLWATFAEESK